MRRLTSRKLCASVQAPGRTRPHARPVVAARNGPGPYLLQCLLQASRLCRQQVTGPGSLLALCLFNADLSQRRLAFPEAQQQHLLQQQRLLQQEQAPPDAAKRGWTQLFSLKAPRKPVPGTKEASKGPQTIADATDLVAANVPVFFFYDQEQYFPCTVEWFLQRARLVLVARGWRRRVLQTLVDFGALDADALAAEQRRFDKAEPKQRKRRFLQMQLQPDARGGEPGDIDKIPIYAHVKQTLDPILGKRDGIEINYMKFLAYNGPYKLFHSIWVGPLGAHDADWEHVTVRLTADGSSVTGVYYSAHRHRDGMWRSADAVPRTDCGRPRAYIAENGHGSYPVAGTILRLFFIINDYTSSDGRKWDPRKVVLVTQNDGDKLPAVVSRGSSLNGTTYPVPSLAAGRTTGRRTKARVDVERQDAAWLGFEGQWGSGVEAPQRQEWFARAENPVSRTWLQQVFFPLLPGVQSVWEPAREEIEEALDNLAEGVDVGMDMFKDAAEDVRREVEQSREAAYRRWREMMKKMKWRDD